VKILSDAPLSLGFLTWRFAAEEESLVLVVKGCYRLEHGGVAQPTEPEGVIGDLHAGDDPLGGACTYASDLVPFKPKADALLVGKAHAPDGRAVTECSTRFEIGEASLTLLVTGDRHWLEPASHAMSEPLPFTEMDIGYDRAFGGPGHVANPAGRGVFAPDARDAAQRPLPNIEDPSHRVKRTSDRPAPAGFGPLGAWWAHRMSKWPPVPSDYAATRWPWPPEGLDYVHFNAAQPALQIDGYLRGDEAIACENLHPKHRRYRSRLPGVRPRLFVLESRGFVEVALRLDTCWIDMQEEKLVLVWRGHLPVASEDFEEIAYAFVASEQLAEPRQPITFHRERFELLRMAAEPPKESEQAAANDNDAPAIPTRPPRVAAADEPVLTAAERRRLEEEGASPAVLAALGRGDVDDALAILKREARVDDAAIERMIADSQAMLRKAIEAAGHDPSILDEAPSPPAPKADKAPAAASPWTRERVEACLATGTPLAKADLTELDLSRLDFSERDLGEALLTGADLSGARFDRAALAGATLARARAQRASFAGAKLADADLTEVVADECDFSEAELTGAMLTGAVLTRAKLCRAKGERASFVRADLCDADLAGAHLSQAIFDGAHLDRAVFRDCNLEQVSADGASGESVDFQGASLIELRGSEGSFRAAKLKGCRADRSRWLGADLSSADLSKASLRNADLSRAELEGVTLMGADCFEVDFTKSLLSRANLSRANLWAARLEGADLRRADLRGASLYRAQLWRAVMEGALLEGAFIAGALLEGPVQNWAGHV
jgi:uncharacterized protein YjbI with pentapeptide repeats